MQIYRGTIQLLDYVFYATAERGKVYETGSFIHNYALVYALGLVRSETYTYARLEQRPHYEEELAPLRNQLYITPGAPRQVAHRLVQWNTLREGYAFPGKPPSLGYPDWGFARVLRPGSSFVFYLVVPDPGTLPEVPALRDLVAGTTVRVRLGKFPAKAGVRVDAAQAVRVKEGPFDTGVLLNWRDLQADPVACDVVVMSLPTRLLARAHFAGGSHYEVRFGDDVIRLPVHMHFLARAEDRERP